MRFAADILVRIPQWKLSYFAVPRAANTSIKLTLATALGYQEGFFMQSCWPHSTAALGVHNRQLAPWSMDASNPNLWLRDNLDHNWLAFTVVREPLQRLWSSWILLVLLEEPHLRAVGWHVACKGDLESATSFAEIVDAFQEFLNSEDFMNLTKHDVHFIPQSTLLAEVLPFVKGWRLDQMAELQSSLDRHLKSYGVAIPEIRRSNESLLPPDLCNLENLNIAHALEVYEEDYSSFDFLPLNSLAVTEPRVLNESDMLHGLQQLREVNLRMYQMWSTR